jgi:multiple sugar transport system permease protein
LLLPSLVLYCAFSLIPTIAALAFSVLRWNLLSPPEFVGAANLQRLVSDERLVTVLGNTVTFTVVTVLVKVTLGLGLALAVWSVKPRSVIAFLESALFFPVILPMAVLAMIGSLIFNTDMGVLNGYLVSAGISRVPWLSDAGWALRTLMLLDIWKTVGFFFLVYLAALRQVPTELLEAAQLDGGGRWARFRYVLLPLTSPTTFFLVVIGSIGSLQVFDSAFIMTRGGPGDASRTLVYYIWENAFQRLDMGYAAAVAVVLLVLTLALTIFQFRLSTRWVFYSGA